MSRAPAQLWSDRRSFGAVPALTRHDFHARLEMWGGGRWPEHQKALSDASAGDVVRADLADADTMWAAAGLPEATATDGASEPGIGTA